MFINFVIFLGRRVFLLFLVMVRQDETLAGSDAASLMCVCVCVVPEAYNPEASNFPLSV